MVSDRKLTPFSSSAVQLTPEWEVCQVEFLNSAGAKDKIGPGSLSVSLAGDICAKELIVILYDTPLSALQEIN
jgi:hypothetical protein